MFNNKKVRNALLLGVLCSVSYLAVYIARNVLGAVTPQMIDTGRYTEEFIGSVSSVYFIFYAVGQLINGAIGDKIKARNMISFGLILAGVCNFTFPILKNELSIQFIYGMTGFFLSMIYGPMTKVVSENTDPIHATRCSLGYTFASFFGSPMAGVMASVMVWTTVFRVSSIVLWAMGVICFVTFLALEKHGIVKYGQYDRKKNGKRDGAIRELFRRDIVAFTVVSLITGVIRTSVIFWLPTCLARYLGFASEQATSIFSLCTLLICGSAFVSIFTFERLKRNMELTLLLMFTISSLSFLGAYLVDARIANIVFMVMAIFFNNCAATMLWSVYCPGLKDTGIVSGATGFLDFMSYMAAAASSTIFANSVSTIGWGNLILVWMALMLVGVATALSFGPKRIFRKADTK